MVTIGYNAFAGMSSLTSIRLGANVGADQLVAAFVGTSALTSIEVDAANTNYASVDGVLYSKDHSHLMLSAGKEYGRGLRSRWRVTQIDDYAFAGATIATVTLPSSARTIGDYAF